MSRNKTIIIAVQALDGLWDYGPADARYMQFPGEFGMFDSAEEAIAAAKQDDLIPPGADFEVRELITPIVG